VVELDAVEKKSAIRLAAIHMASSALRRDSLDKKSVVLIAGFPYWLKKRF
jgi:hypothetical protein